MSAVFGVVGLPSAASETLITQMHVSARFRGEDLSSHCAEGFAMSASHHSTEAGPFLFANKARTVFAVCEGELYNTRDLARTLGAPSSTEGFEIVPELFERKGTDFPREMNGVFGIAVFDTVNRALYLVRDHAGSHSIFYATAGAQVCFSTTIPALFATGLVKPELSGDALDSYLACLAISPPETIFKGVSSVRPGHMVVIRDGMTSEHSYWPFDAVTEDRTRSESDLADEIRALFIDAVKIRASCPGSYGALISGGVDTGAIAAVLAREGSQRELHGFSISFDEQAYNDADLQQQMYQQYAIHRHQLLLKPGDFEDALVKGAAYLDSPVNDVAYVGMYKAMELVKKAGLAAAFEGEGSDEIFTTGHSRIELSFQKYMTIPDWVRRSTFGVVFRNMPVGDSFLRKAWRFGCRLGMAEHERLSTWVPIMHNCLRRRLHPSTTYIRYPYSHTRHYLSSAGVEDPINRYNYLLTRLFLADDLLYKNERMAAAHGITNRTPFVDYRIVELGFRVPARFKLQNPTATHDMTKLIFKKAMQGIVPDPVLLRFKRRGFSQPTSLWYRKELKDFIVDLLMSPGSMVAGCLDRRQIEQICNVQLSGASNLDYHLNSLVILELWMRSHL
jgi:asparagine synthase (glutamine-hydrolysing)